MMAGSRRSGGVEAAALLCLVAAFQAACSPEVEAPSEPVRNVLFLMGDDHSVEVLGVSGNQLIDTPSLDGLARKGIRFEHAYVNSPVCTPSRQSIITGKLPHAVGVTLLRTALPESALTIAEHLGGLGFATGAVGKMHFNSELNHGFEYRVDTPDHREWIATNRSRPVPPDQPVRPTWRPFQDPARIWLNADGLPGGEFDVDSEGSWFAARAVEFLRANRERRFCLWVSFREPHSPFNFPVEFAGRKGAAEMPLPLVGPDDDRWIPRVFRDLSEEDKRGIVASYYTSVEYLDRNVGLVLLELERLGLDDDTLVIYVGDNGYLLGHHGRFEKHSMWEPAVRVPLLLRAPGVKPRVEQALVEFVDLVPTILDFLEVTEMPGLQGNSLKPLVQGKAGSHRDEVFSEFLPDNLAMLRTRAWKYVFTTGQADLAMGYGTGLAPPGLTHRLFNVLDDPEELRNLAGLPEHSKVLGDLQRRMLERFRETDPRSRRIPESLPVVEQLALFCQPPEAE